MDLNFALPEDGHASLLHNFLRNRSYVFLVRSNTRSVPSRPSLLHHIEIMEHSISKRRVHISYYSTVSIAAIVLDGHSTLMANCITADAFHCYYPETTLRRCCLRLQKTATSETHFSKYVNRGFTMRPQVMSEVNSPMYEFKSSIDERVLRVALSNRPTEPFQSVNWVLPFRPTNGTSRQHKIGFVSTDVEGFGT